MKLMASFLCLMIILSFVDSKKILKEKNEDYKEYESPVIVKSREYFLKTPKSHDEIRNKLRNDLIRAFNPTTLQKWLENIKNQNSTELTKTEEINNINDIKQMTIQMKKMINNSNSKIEEIMRWITMKNEKLKKIEKKIEKIENPKKNQKKGKKSKKKKSSFQKQDEFDKLLF